MPTMTDVENYARALGIPVEEAAQKLGMAVEKGLQPQVDALQQLAKQAWYGPQKTSPVAIPNQSPSPDRNGSTLANQGVYDKQLSDRLKRNADAATAHQKWVDENSDDSGYTKYADGGTAGYNGQIPPPIEQTQPKPSPYSDPNQNWLETAKQLMTDPTKRPDMHAMGGEVASHDPDLGKDRFMHLKDMLSKHKKAKSELEASKNPEKFMEKNKNMSIRGLKGVAF